MLSDDVKSAFSKVGVRVSARAIALVQPKIIHGKHYEAILPEAKYAPWRDDLEFKKVYGAVDKNTLVDIYRCFELWELVGQIGRIDGDILEVGVWRGGTGALMASQAQGLSMAKTVFLCDTFAGVVKASDEDDAYVGGEHADTSEAIVAALVRRLGLSNVELRRGIFPDEFMGEMATKTFSFVHIDVDVYQSAKDVLNFVWPRISPGGIVVFDDYGFETCTGIPSLVAEYRGDHDKLVLHNLNGHAIFAKRG